MKNFWVLFNRYLYHYRKFSIKGLFFYYKIRTSKNDIIECKLDCLLHSFYLRRNSADIDVFKQIFCDNHYKIDFGFEPAVILDLGANIGMATLYFKNRFPNSAIIAVEPDPDNFKILLQNTKHYSDVICLNKGIWHKQVALEIFNRAGGEWALMTKESGDHMAGNIQAITIPDIMQMMSLEKIDVIKMDIEGAEKEIFEHDIQPWLTKVKVLVVELHDRYKYGCSMAFYKAMNGFEFSTRIRGENIICDIKGKSSN